MGLAQHQKCAVNSLPPLPHGGKKNWGKRLKGDSNEGKNDLNLISSGTGLFFVVFFFSFKVTENSASFENMVVNQKIL